ncbi:MAG TPA: hypothetical protein VFA97_11125 [Gaiellaceae bacterium]|nr:hypothetical protein [Gaiellaceae bacterium]
MTETLELEPDWGDVLSRARRAGRTRRTLEAAAVLAVVVVGVASAYALGHPVIDFGTAKHAGVHEVDEFGSMQVGAPRGMAPGVLPHQTRRITAVRIDGKVHTLYVAPTKRGGFCYEWTGLGGGCRANRHDKYAARIDTGGSVGPHGLTVLEGSFFQAKGDRLSMTFKNGQTADVPFVFVSEPISAGFYLYRVPDAHRRAATRATSLALYDKDGKLIDREPIVEGRSPLVTQRPHRLPGFGVISAPAAGIWAKRTQLFDLRAPNGQRVGLWVMPKRGGGTCYVTNTGSGCSFTAPKGSKPLPLIMLGFNGDRLCCSVSTRVARVEARFQDGDRISLYPKEGYLVWPIPAEHYALGHRLVALVGYDAAGRAIARGRVPKPADQRGIYPCKQPKNLGYGVKECA